MITDASVAAPEMPVMSVEMMASPVAPAAVVCLKVKVAATPSARPRLPVSVPAFDVRLFAPPLKAIAFACPFPPMPPAIEPLLTMVRFEPVIPAPPLPSTPGWP